MGAALMRQWAKLATPKPAKTATWAPVGRMIVAAKQYSCAFEDTLRELLDRSDCVLQPLKDPLHADMGLHRWLAAEREEAYSDWLAWILQQLDARSVLHLLNVDTEELARECDGLPVVIEREVCIPSGRLDILVRIGEMVLVLIEVKTTSADSAETAKQRGYCEWLATQSIPIRPRPLLIAIEASEQDYDGFSPLLWADLAVCLRQLLPNVMGSLGIVRAAMIVAFLSAVEVNLLDLARPGEHGTGRSLLYTRTADHVQRGLGKTT